MEVVVLCDSVDRLVVECTLETVCDELVDTASAARELVADRSMIAETLCGRIAMIGWVEVEKGEAGLAEETLLTLRDEVVELGEENVTAEAREMELLVWTLADVEIGPGPCVMLCELAGLADTD